jgi:NitT/TauT family transport system substrate-binding protein
MIVSETTAKQKPEVVKAFLRASIKGWKEAFANPKGAVDSVIAIAPTLDRAHQNFMLASVRQLMTAGQAGENGLFWIDPAAIKTTHDFFLEYKVLPKPVDLAAAFDASFLHAIPRSDRTL